MLSAQRNEFEEKKKGETPYPRDFTRWYALDYFRRPRSLRSSRFFVTLATTVAFLLLSIATLAPALHRAHQAAPVSKAHAMLNENCASCHDRMFQPVLRLFGCTERSVSNKRCNDCHHGAPHHGNEPACASCHVEHRGHEMLATHVADRNCVACHGQGSHVHPIDAKRPMPITNFNRDHPEFQPSLKGKADTAKLKFNHKAHLDLDLDDLRRTPPHPPLGKGGPAGGGRDDLKGLASKMACADCHQLDDERKYIKPIVYENHCARCHALNVGLVGDFAPDLREAVAGFSKTPLPHREPAVVRAVLRDRLVEFAQKHAVVASKGTPSVPRPLPWRPVTEEQWSWAKAQAQRAEELLFTNKQWSRHESLTQCAHCHIETERPAGLPSYHKTAIPARWYTHSIFNHGSHRAMNCTDCHDKNAAGVKVADSQTTADILMPTLQSCQECHKGSGGARNACVECHRYHQR